MSTFDIFLNGQERKFKGTIILKDKTLDHGRVTEIENSDDKSFECYFYRQGMSRINIGQTFKTDVTACAITSPDKISVSDFTKDCRLRIEQENKISGDFDDLGDFDVIYAENIGGLDAIIQIALKQVI